MSETNSSENVPGHLRRVAEDFERLGRQLMRSSQANPFEAPCDRGEHHHREA